MEVYDIEINIQKPKKGSSKQKKGSSKQKKGSLDKKSQAKWSESQKNQKKLKSKAHIKKNRVLRKLIVNSAQTINCVGEENSDIEFLFNERRYYMDIEEFIDLDKALEYERPYTNNYLHHINV